MKEWHLDTVAEVFIDVSAKRLWAALTEAPGAERYFMRSRVTVGGAGETHHLKRDDGWRVDGIVLTKEPPNRLRVTWLFKIIFRKMATSRLLITR